MFTNSMVVEHWGFLQPGVHCSMAVKSLELPVQKQEQSLHVDGDASFTLLEDDLNT